MIRTTTQIQTAVWKTTILIHCLQFIGTYDTRLFHCREARERISPSSTRGDRCGASTGYRARFKGQPVSGISRRASRGASVRQVEMREVDSSVSVGREFELELFSFHSDRRNCRVSRAAVVRVVNAVISIGRFTLPDYREDVSAALQLLNALG